MEGGCHVMRSPASSSASLASSTRINHWLVTMYSTGVSQRSCTRTAWTTGSWPSTTPRASRASTMRRRASGTGRPARSPAISVMWPSRSIASLSGRLCAYHHSTSAVSPKVQHITAPVPFSGSAPGSVVDRAVGVAPIHGEPQPPPQRLVRALGLLAHVQARLDEAAAPDRGGGAAELPLHQALRGQAVVVEAHGVEHVVAVHAPEARDEVGMAVGIDAAEMQVAGDGRRWGVDGVDRPPIRGREVVDAALLPGTVQGWLRRLRRVTLRESHDHRPPMCFGCAGHKKA